MPETIVKICYHKAWSKYYVFVFYKDTEEIVADFPLDQEQQAKDKVIELQNQYQCFKKCKQNGKDLAWANWSTPTSNDEG